MEQSKGRALSKRGETLSWIVTSEKLWYFLLILISIIAGFFLLTSPRPEIVPALALALILGSTFFFYPYLGVLTYIILSYMRFEDIIPALMNLHLTRLLAIALILVWAIRAAITKSKLYLQEKGLILLYLFFLMLAFSIPFSFWPTKSFNTFVDMLKILIFTILFIQLIDTQKKLKSFFWVFLTVNGFLAFNAIKDFILLGATAVSTRIGGGGEGFLGDANDFALALNVALPFTFYLFLSEKKKVLKSLYLLFLILFTLGVISTASRGGFITLFFVFFYFILKSKQKLIGIFAIVLIFISIYFFAPREYWERQMTITAYQKDESAMGRIDAWKAGIKMFTDRPLSGVGVGAYVVAYGVKYGGTWRATHNAYIQIAAETGIFGILF
ncbi:MAG: O-antigen ligase family protein, partial [candidate division Zixibacteria bacterium]|nr:O-antigen ligase family protein [candidate division Zixibacteria bacterium]